MKWSEVLEKFPAQFLLVEELASHQEGDKLIVDDVSILRHVDDAEATEILLNCTGNTFVAHTGNKQIMLELRQRPGLRGRIQAN